jgi:hypothetical protein
MADPTLTLPLPRPTPTTTCSRLPARPPSLPFGERPRPSTRPRRSTEPKLPPRSPREGLARETARREATSVSSINNSLLSQPSSPTETRTLANPEAPFLLARRCARKRPRLDSEREARLASSSKEVEPRSSRRTRLPRAELVRSRRARARRNWRVRRIRARWCRARRRRRKRRRQSQRKQPRRMMGWSFLRSTS